MDETEGKHARIVRYEAAYDSDYGFEGVMVEARRHRVLKTLRSLTHDVIVEVGCGSELLIDSAAAAGLTWQRWIIVEPSERFAAIASQATRRHDGVTVVTAFVEEAVEQVAAATGHGADIVVCSSMLHEVKDVRSVLEAVGQMLSKNGRLHVNVPNAGSLHRRLARAMGIITDEHELAARNRTLEQYRVYDLRSLVGLLESSGFIVETTGGYFLKPFTHSQMATINFFTDEMFAGLYKLGAELPDLAAEIYANARFGDERSTASGSHIA